MLKINEKAFVYYFRFIEKRMQIFWSRHNNAPYPWTNDDILKKYKFTNVYRACDRVSQYLINEVILNADKRLNEEDILLNIIIFKIFNKIETWKYLKSEFDLITVKDFNPAVISEKLSKRINTQPIFSAAYIMTASGGNYKSLQRKHERWLHMVDREILKSHKLHSLLTAKSLNEIYELLSECTFIGPFLAYQYAIDLNYTDIIDFDENSFVKAGIGAKRGIDKCFISLGKYSYEDAIRFTQDNFDNFSIKYGTSFKNLFGRHLKLIDLQNCFCETDKYLRVKLPELNAGNNRIKQIYKLNELKIKFNFPRKWKLNI